MTQNRAQPENITSNRTTVTVFVAVTLTFDLLTSGSMHAERLLYSIRVPSLVLIAPVRARTDRQTRLNALPLQYPRRRLCRRGYDYVDHALLCT